MNNGGWHNYETDPPPDGSTVLVWFDAEAIGTRFGLRSSFKISSGYLVAVNGHMEYNSPDTILAWRYLDDIEASIPLEFM